MSTKVQPPKDQPDHPIPAKRKAILLPSNEIVDCLYIHDRAVFNDRIYEYCGTSEGVAHYRLDRRTGTTRQIRSR